MLENITNKITGIFQSLSNKGAITEKDLETTLREVRVALLEADVSLKVSKDLIKNISQNLNETDFAVTDLSHSRAIIELEGKDLKEVLKKGSPFNFNELNENMSVNTTFNGITVTIDMIEDDPNKARLLSLRSFGESLYNSITDSCLEFGYKSK